MRRVLAVLVVLGCLSGCAGQGDYVSVIVGGQIVQMDEETITLDSGATYIVPPERAFLLQNLGPDQRVTIKYRPTENGNVLYDVMRAGTVVRTRS